MINLIFVYISNLQLTGTTKIVYTELYCFIIMKLFQSKLKLITAVGGKFSWHEKVYMQHFLTDSTNCTWPFVLVTLVSFSFDS